MSDLQKIKIIFKKLIEYKKDYCIFLRIYIKNFEKINSIKEYQILKIIKSRYDKFYDFNKWTFIK